MKLKYKNEKISECDCKRTIEQEAQEIENRINYFYKKTDGSLEFANAQECQIYPLLLDLIKKIKQEAKK